MNDYLSKGDLKLELLTLNIDLEPNDPWEGQHGTTSNLFSCDDYNITLTGSWGKGASLVLVMCGVGEPQPTVQIFTSNANNNDEDVAVAQLNFQIQTLMSSHLVPLGWKYTAVMH